MVMESEFSMFVSVCDYLTLVGIRIAEIRCSGSICMTDFCVHV